MKEMHEVIKNSVAKLGFKTADIKIMLSSHAHFDHIEGHALMKKLTGAQVMAMVGDAEALAGGKGQLGARRHRLGAGQGRSRAEAWRHRVAWRHDAARAAHARAHTGRDDVDHDGAGQGATRTRWGSSAARRRTGAFRCSTTRATRTVIEDTQRTFKTLKAEKPPDIYLVGHPQAMFTGKVERIKAGETPHPLLNGDAWTKQIVDGEANFEKRVAEERAKLRR